MATPRRAQIQQIDAVIKSLHDKLHEQFNKETPAEKAQFKIAVLEGIFEKAKAFYENVAAQFTVSCEPDADAGGSLKEGTGKMLKASLKQFDDKFHPTVGKQEIIIQSEAQAYLDKGLNNLSANMSDISADENSVYLITLTILGILYRQRFCLMQMQKVAAKDGSSYTNLAGVLKMAFKAAVEKVKPQAPIGLKKEQQPQAAMDLKMEQQQFNAVFDELIRRLKTNDNPKSFEVNKDDQSALAQFIRKVNAELFTAQGKSRFLSKDYLDQLKADTEAAAVLGKEADVLELQKKAKAAKIWMSAIVQNLGKALQEYQKEINKKVQSVDSAFMSDLEESLKSRGTVIEMRYILKLADAMFKSEHLPDENKPLSDYLKEHVQTLQEKTSNLGRKNGWRAVGVMLKEEVDKLNDQLAELVQKYRDDKNRAKVDSTWEEFKAFKAAFDDQHAAHHQFPNALTMALSRWEGERAHAEIPGYLDANWLRPCKEIADKTPSGVRSFLNRHWGKMTIGALATGVAAVLFGIFVFTVAWPVIVTLAIIGMIAGAAIVAMGAKLSDKCCKADPVNEEITLEQAESILEMDLPPGAKPRRNSSAESFAKLNGAMESVVVMGDDKPKAAAPLMVATLAAVPAPSGDYNPFTTMDDGAEAAPAPVEVVAAHESVSPNNPFK